MSHKNAIALVSDPRRSLQGFTHRYYIKQFILFHQKRHPNEMVKDEIRAYATNLKG